MSVLDFVKQASGANAVSITSVESITIRISGMRGSCEYVVNVDSVQAMISFYRFKYSNGEEVRELEKETTCAVEELMYKITSCNVGSWNGFHGTHPRGVLDGEQFGFEAEVNGGAIIKAEGSANFPNGFREFQRWMDEMLNA